ncbi:MAG: 2-dehydropantoate 2-reductase [Deltaproteobacteria bacterium]|nr:2-dehydropantoate 2-reductase [Deltaproteobacteria bacterium]
MDSEHKYAFKDVWIYGVGGVGGYFGGKIAYEASAHPDSAPNVYFIARGNHFLAIRRRGLKLNTAEKDGIICVPYHITDRPETLPKPDLCLLCVKSYDLDAALVALLKQVKDSTIIIPLLNGVDIHERVRIILKSGIVLPACAYVGTHIEEAGVVTQKGAPGVMLCGKDPAFQDFNPEPLITFFNDSDIKFTWVDDPFPAIWEKFIFIAAFGLVTAYSDKTLGGVAADPELRELVEKIMGEILTIAKKKEISLPSGIVETSIAKANNFPFETKTSYQRDIEAKGRLNEGDLFGGTIIKMGKDEKIPIPVTQRIYESIELKLTK